MIRSRMTTLPVLLMPCTSSSRRGLLWQRDFSPLIHGPCLLMLRVIFYLTADWSEEEAIQTLKYDGKTVSLAKE